MTVPASEFLEASRNEQNQILGQLFEKCDTLNAYIHETLSGPITSYHDLIESVRVLLLKLLQTSKENQKLDIPVDARIDAIVAAHPRLGAKEPLLAHSLLEQESLAGESAVLEKLNREYEEAFPGLRYVVFVNGRSRPQIVQEMRDRIERGDIWLERYDAFNAMCDIAISRL